MPVKSSAPREHIDCSEPPFAVPAVIVLDLPVPPSVNRTRMVHWSSRRHAFEWTDKADRMVMAQRKPGQPRRIPGRYELHITMSEKHTGIDLDNGIKALVDYLHRIEIVEDDSPKYFRRLIVEWGAAIEGCRVTVRGLT